MLGENRQETARSLTSIGILVPVFNEEAAIESFYRAVRPVLDKLGCAAEIWFVDDGSRDGTATAVRSLKARDPDIRLIRLSRNFGKEAALTAGMDRIDTDVVVPIDVDLQDPPEVIPDMVARWREGHDVVYAIRSDRSSDTAAKRLTANWFYRAFNFVSHDPIPLGAGDFRLIDRRVVKALRRLPERNRFMKGLFAWVGFSSVGITYVRAPRSTGQTKLSWRRLWHLALDGITGFSTLPLRIWTYLGFLVAALAFAYGLFILLRTLVFGSDVPGYASLMVAVLFLGGIQLISLGVIGEYLGRLFLEAKQRPIYVVDDEN